MHAAPLAATTRGYPDLGNIVENIHLGAVAVCDAAGRLLWSAGDPSQAVFTRSTLKPFQALPFVLGGGPAHFALELADLALLCASHSGEARHVARIEAMLGKFGMDESRLACGCHAPLYYDSVGQPPPGRQWRQVHHNCSGKHSGFLGWCRLHGVDSAGYVERGHRLQQAVRATLAATTGIPEDRLAAGIDGCSAPNYALPLSVLAQLYARLALGGADVQHGAAMGELSDAMRSYPELVSGEGRSDLAYMHAGAGDWVCKAGADGVQAIGIRSAGLGIAIKIGDGAARALPVATVAVLDQLGVPDARQARLLEPYRQPLLRNVRGTVVGDVRPLLRLRSA